MRKYLVAALVALVSTDAAAADWRLVSTAADGMRTYLDVSSVVTNGNYRTTWEKTVNAKLEGDGTAYAVDHWSYDCSKRTFVLLSWVRYRGDGSTISSNQIPAYSREERDVVPDTIGEALFKLVCN